MQRPHVEWIRIEDFRCVRKLDLRLTPLHALVGPNDSGKSTILSAIALGSVACWLSSGVGFDSSRRSFVRPYPDPSLGAISDTDSKALIAAWDVRQLLRLDPDTLRQPTNLIPRGHPGWFRSEKGLGLAALYDWLLSRDRNAFVAIDERFRALFPTVAALRLENPDAHTKAMGLSLVDGTDVGPNEMSEGMLYWLAFAVIEHLRPAGILLVEEPENGLHPARIAEVMRVLRDVSTRTQVIVATHSPLVINELHPEEVTIVTRDREHGTMCTPMPATKNFAERSQVYALGELWLAYADGDLERELVGASNEVAKAG